MGKQIRSGTVNDICKREGEWMFIDLGFSETKPTCGILNVIGQTDEVTFCDKVTFGETVTLTKLAARQSAPSPLNLVLEAPLSVTFNQDGNPTGRACDFKDGKGPRRWHNQPAPMMILAAGFLLLALANYDIQRGVKLFEGFVSFKEQGSESDHLADAKALKDVVWSQNQDRIFTPAQLKQCESDHLKSAFGFMGMDFGIPPVIRP